MAGDPLAFELTVNGIDAVEGGFNRAAKAMDGASASTQKAQEKAADAAAKWGQFGAAIGMAGRAVAAHDAQLGRLLGTLGQSVAIIGTLHNSFGTLGGIVGVASAAFSVYEGAVAAAKQRTAELAAEALRAAPGIDTLTRSIQANIDARQTLQLIESGRGTAAQQQAAVQNSADVAARLRRVLNGTGSAADRQAVQGYLPVGQSSIRQGAADLERYVGSGARADIIEAGSGLTSEQRAALSDRLRQAEAQQSRYQQLADEQASRGSFDMRQYPQSDVGPYGIGTVGGAGPLDTRDPGQRSAAQQAARNAEAARRRRGGGARQADSSWMENGIAQKRAAQEQQRDAEAATRAEIDRSNRMMEARADAHDRDLALIDAKREKERTAAMERAKELDEYGAKGEAVAQTLYDAFETVASGQATLAQAAANLFKQTLAQFAKSEMLEAGKEIGLAIGSLAMENYPGAAKHFASAAQHGLVAAAAGGASAAIGAASSGGGSGRSNARPEAAASGGGASGRSGPTTVIVNLPATTILAGAYADAGRMISRALQAEAVMYGTGIAA